MAKEEEHVGLKYFLLLIIFILIVIIIIINLSKRYTIISFEEKVQLKNNLDFSVSSNRVVDDSIYPTNYLIGNSYYDLLENGNCILDVIVDVTNNSTISTPIEKIFKSSELLIGNTHYDVTILFEDENGNSFIDVDDTKEIEGNQSLKSHFCLGIDYSELLSGGNACLIIKTSKGNYGYNMSIISDELSKNNDKSIININYRGKEFLEDEKVTIPNLIDFKIIGSKYTNIIESSNNIKSNSYYEAQSGKIYLDLKVNVTNTSQIEKKLEDMMGYGVLEEGNNNYSFTKIVEFNDGRLLTGDNENEKILPNQTLLYHLVAEVPEKTSKDTSELYIKMHIAGEDYYCKYR